MVGGKNVELVFAWRIIVIILVIGNAAVLDEVVPFDLALEIVEHVFEATRARTMGYTLRDAHYQERGTRVRDVDCPLYRFFEHEIVGSRLQQGQFERSLKMRALRQCEELCRNFYSGSSHALG